MTGDGQIKKMRRPVGAGLSLEKFAKAKQSGYDKRKVIKKQRNENAKKVNKFRKMLKKLEASGELAPMRPWEHATGAAEEQDGAEATAGRVGEPSSSGRKNQTTETKSKSSTKTKAAVAKEERDGSSDDAKGKTKDAGKIMKKKGYNAVLAAAKKAEEIKKQKEAAQLEKEKRIAAREEALKERKKKKKLFFKKTKTGQPVLKARMQVLLEKIEKGMQ